MLVLLGALLWLPQTAGAVVEKPGPPAPSATYISPKVTCPPGAEEVRRLTGLSFRDFDQDPVGGWRPYAAAGCYVEAARLISIHIEKTEEDRSLAALRWHRFQMLAFAGEGAGARDALSELKAFDSHRGADAGWKLYVAGTQAFMEGKRGELEQKATDLSALASSAGPGGTGIRLNANILQGLLRCFGKPYRVAYTPPCVDPDMAREIGRQREQPQPRR